MKKLSLILPLSFAFIFVNPNLSNISFAASVPDQSFLSQTASVIQALTSLIKQLEEQMTNLGGRQTAQVASFQSNIYISQNGGGDGS